MTSQGNPLNKGRLGVDIGGTFTDVVLEFQDQRFTRKVLTTNDNPVSACMRGIAETMHEAQTDPSDINTIIHGTTLATNAVIERKGAITSLVTTEGFRDTIEIGTEGRPEQYDINIVKPEPLVPRRRRFVVSERLNSAGEVLLELDESSLDALLPALDRANTEALAVGFLHSYVNPIHEVRTRDFFAKHRPAWSISLSSEVSPEFREFERFSTTCANAYVQPMVSSYLADFNNALKSQGFSCPLMLMLSNGGLTNIKTAQQFPVRLIESGPAGGAIFAGDVARRCNVDRAISFDMGGTTAKVCMLDDGRAQSSRRFEVGRVYRFRKDSGIPLRIPVIDMVEIGAGGGSVAHVDELGRLAVGPESAGSSPGPACYGLGGKRPTVTDANLLMHRIDPDGFAGGKMALDANAASQAMVAGVSSILELGTVSAAFGVTEMVCENMASAARVHAIESGKNANDRTLIAFGGAAPLHACQLADKLGISRILVPANAGVGSAVGFLRAPVAYEVVRTLFQSLERFDCELTDRVNAEMQSEARHHVEAATGTGVPLSYRRRAYMRYRGQGHEIPVETPVGSLGADAPAMLQSLFDQEYRKVFGRNVGGVATGEIVSWSVMVSSPPHPDLVEPPAARTRLRSTAREVFDSVAESMKAFAVVARKDLNADQTIDGPAIIVEDETSIIVSSSFDARVLPGGDINLVRRLGK